MLRKTKIAGIYKSGRDDAGVHTFTHEGTTRLLPAAQKTADAIEQIGAREALAGRKGGIVADSNANRLRGGQWRHTW